MCAYLVSRALRILLRGCCSGQLIAGFPAVGRVMALSTREVMAWTASTFIWVLSRSSCTTNRHISSVTHSTQNLCLSFWQELNDLPLAGFPPLGPSWLAEWPAPPTEWPKSPQTVSDYSSLQGDHMNKSSRSIIMYYTKGWTIHEVCLMSTHSDTDPIKHHFHLTFIQIY